MAMNDFQQAVAAAQACCTAEAWRALPVQFQSRAIYAELRRIDAERLEARPDQHAALCPASPLSAEPLVAAPTA